MPGGGPLRDPTASKWPRRIAGGIRAGDLVFGPLDHSRVLGILPNPRYAGTFVYGRSQRKVVVGAQVRYRRLARAEWQGFLPNAHPGYIAWEEFEGNQATLPANAAGYGTDRRRSPARCRRRTPVSASAIGGATPACVAHATRGAV